MEKFNKEFFLNFLPEEENNKTDSGECSQCGECCIDHLCVTTKEIKEIRRFIMKKKIEPINYAKEILRMPPICPFRDNMGKRCLIYQVRPRVCKDSTCGTSIEERANILYKRQWDRSNFEVSMHMLFVD